MITTEPFYPLTMFSKEAIDNQMARIVDHRIFLDSPILRKFFIYIVAETLKGNGNQLKEYTIAVNVLSKPRDFRPQESGIVRIHAGRLRRALNKYYAQDGVNDTVRISMPKGGYIPAFDINDPKHQRAGASETQQKTTIGIASVCNKNPQHASFADTFGVQLSTALMKSDHFSIIAYHSMQKLFEDYVDFEKLASAAGVQYLLTGDLQSLGNNLRIHLQLIGVRTGYLVWSQMYERNFSAEKLFEVQDEIVKKAALDLAGLHPR